MKPRDGETAMFAQYRPILARQLAGFQRNMRPVLSKTGCGALG